MTVNEVCEYFDLSEIVNTQMDIDRDYYSAIGKVYTDGIVKSHITREGYIHITSVKDATYFIFLNREYQTCLCVYKYIPDITCKYIIENLHLLKSKINEVNEISEDTTELDNYTDKLIDDDVIDLNTFTCTECESENKMIFIRSKTNPDALETKCTTCKTEYIFVPSKYYKLASKRIIYFKSENSSRQIEISEYKENKTANDSSVKAAIIPEAKNDVK